MILTPIKTNIISFAINTYKFILDSEKNHYDLITSKNQIIFVKVSYFFYVNNMIIGIDDNPIFMRIDLIENDCEDLILSNIQEIGDCFLTKYSNVTGEYLVKKTKTFSIIDVLHSLYQS